jgi:hypothetical protein
VEAWRRDAGGQAAIRLTVSNASGVACPSGMRIWYFFSRKHLSDTIESGDGKRRSMGPP